MPRPSLGSTPEQLLGRNDSKNPNTTCKGITSSGRPCRRALAVSKLLDNADVEDHNGVVAIIREGDRLADAQYFCWQHKDQAEQAPAPAVPGINGKQKREVLELKSRNSISSLMQTLNVREQETSRRTIQLEYVERRSYDRPRQSRRAPPKHPSIWRNLCCMLAAEDDDTIEIVRRRNRVRQGSADNATAAVPRPQRPMAQPQYHAQKTVADQPLSYIKSGTSPQIAACLLTELAKPISPTDEDGYIYIFWLTPAESSPPRRAASTLLTPGARRERRLSDVMSGFSVPSDSTRAPVKGQRKIMLKIGRANNVTRRMNEWQRQCGYDLSLVRRYPHVSQSPLASPRRSPERPNRDEPHYPELSQHGRPSTTRQESDHVRKVPCVKRVERLIHLELGAKQVKQQCGTCGKEHREWFTIDANEQGIRQIDETIRRWVQWSEDQHRM